MRRRKIGFMAAVGVALVAATVYQARAMGAGTATPKAVAPVASGPARVAAEGRVVTYPGAEVVVAAERGGRVVRVRVEEGQRVEKGDLLAELDSDELRATL
ncbi:MAG TPA: biotin/lipoyl-binding protein, partial [Chloroflexota bacterium]|nr:biotin/lipoyl-binding protein [Chloroflexota bacterium]